MIMSEPSAPNPNPNPDALSGRLRDCAERLRHARHIEADAQTALADLLADLADAIDPSSSGTGADAAAAAHLGESTAHLAEALHHAPSHEPGVLAAARRKVEEAAAKAEAEAPIATGVVRQFIDVLGGMGV
jgi:hypothetical protein